MSAERDDTEVIFALADGYGAPVALAAALIERIDLDKRVDTHGVRTGHAQGTHGVRTGHARAGHTQDHNGLISPDLLHLRLIMHRIADDLSAACKNEKGSSKRAKLARRAGMHAAISAAIRDARLYSQLGEAIGELHRR